MNRITPKTDPLHYLEKIARCTLSSPTSSPHSDNKSENNNSDGDHPTHSTKLLATPCTLIPPRRHASYSKKTSLIPRRYHTYSSSENTSENSESDDDSDVSSDQEPTLKESQHPINITRQTAVRKEDLDVFCSFIDHTSKLSKESDNEDHQEDQQEDQQKDYDKIISRVIQTRIDKSSVPLNDNTAYMFHTLHILYALFKEYGLTCHFLREIKHCPLLVLWFVQSLCTLPHCVYEYYVNMKASVPTHAKDPAKIFTENLKYVLAMARCISALSCYTKNTLEESALLLHNTLAQHKTDLIRDPKRSNYLNDEYDTINFDKWKKNPNIVYDTTPCAIAYQYSILYENDYNGLIHKFDHYLHGQIDRIDLTKFPIDESPSRKVNMIKGHGKRSVR